MKTLELNQMGLQSLSHEESSEIEGGFLPVLVIYGCWTLMACCCAVAAGMSAGANAK